jgi:hypothetical protein
MNGFVKRDGEKFLWIGKRSPVKQTFPGMLDHLVAGGLVCNYLLYSSVTFVIHILTCIPFNEIGIWFALSD